MGFDWYLEYRIQGLDSVDNLRDGENRYEPVEDVLAKVKLLATALHREDRGTFYINGNRKREVAIKVYAREGHDDRPPSGLKFLLRQAADAASGLRKNLTLMEQLGIPGEPTTLQGLQDYFWCLSMQFSLAKPYISKDDITFYIIENPVRKEKVFQVPMVSDTSWKGNLRWATMKVRLEDRKDTLTPAEFARERLRQAVLFGTEEGSREGEPVGFARHLDKMKPDAKDEYRKLLAEHFADQPGGLLHHQGRLHFYPTFFNSMDMDIINPHDRKTGAGRDPVHMECVPGEGKVSGTFRLLYFAFDLLGKPADTMCQETVADLEAVVEGLKAMMLRYGFSAKKSSGFGLAQEGFEEGKLNLHGNREPFGNFYELNTVINRQKERLGHERSPG